MVKGLAGRYDSRNRQIQQIHMTHQVTLWAAYLSDMVPPTARSTPPGSEKHAGSSAAMRMPSPYSPASYCTIHSESAK